VRVGIVRLVWGRGGDARGVGRWHGWAALWAGFGEVRAEVRAGGEGRREGEEK
jgi:hypothetical protein